MRMARCVAHTLQKWHNLNKFSGKAENYLEAYKQLFTKYILLAKRMDNYQQLFL